MCQHEQRCGCGREEGFISGPSGNLQDSLIFVPDWMIRLPPPIEWKNLQPWSYGSLNGSWLLDLTPTDSKFAFPLTSIRGPMRIEATKTTLRASGDIYVRRTLVDIKPPFSRLDEMSDGPLDNGLTEDGAPATPWYPAFPKEQYSWYFRTTGVSYLRGELTMTIERSLWNAATGSFAPTSDTGTLTLTCDGVGTPLVMEGTLEIGGQRRAVRATKTSDRYRGLEVEVDVMTNRTFPASATVGTATVDFRGIYARAGIDVTVTVDELTVPEDADLTVAELQALLSAHRGAITDHNWRVWLLVGSSQGNTFGLMFDDDAVPREGAVGFADATFGNDPRILTALHNQPLGSSPEAFLRTLVHEVGHALNLFHPKHDVHAPDVGREIMNQTGDVIGFASALNPYPINIVWAFHNHDVVSLIHSPDPQVKPGWRNFGFGHGSLWSGMATPTDIAGLPATERVEHLELSVEMATQVFVGEYLTAKVTLTNTGESAREVTTLLSLAHGDLMFSRTKPDGSIEHLLDVTVACGPRPMVILEPGQSVSSQVQVFFTNGGHTFEEPGRHTIAAHLVVDPVTTVVSDPLVITVRMPGTEQEVSIAEKTLDEGVGRAMALGDFGRNDAAAARLTELAEEHADADTGAAAALVMANSLGRAFHDIANDAMRDAAPREADKFLALAAKGRSQARLMELAVTVANPADKEAPVVAATLDLVSGTTPSGRKRAKPPTTGDGAVANEIAEDFLEPRAR